MLQNIWCHIEKQLYIPLLNRHNEHYTPLPYHLNFMPDQFAKPWNIQYIFVILVKYYLLIMLNMSNKVPKMKFWCQYSLGLEQ